jgi:single-strand DNA-binding protein
MAGSVNKVVLIGRLGSDPEIRNIGRGDTRVAEFSLATSESWKDKASGERKERTEWHRVKVWNKVLIGICENYLGKGDLVYVEGMLETEKVGDGDDAKYFTKVVLKAFAGEINILKSKSDGNSDDDRGNYDRVGRGGGDNRGGGGRDQGRGRSEDKTRGFGRGGGGFGGGSDMDDEIPF